MKKTRGQRREELKAKADELIEQLLDWTDETDKPNLTQIEDIVLKLRSQLGRAMAESVISAQENRQPVEKGVCPKCGAEMRNKGRRERQVESRAGEIELERGYYQCTQCGGKIFPPGPTTGAERETLE